MTSSSRHWNSRSATSQPGCPNLRQPKKRRRSPLKPRRKLRNSRWAIWRNSPPVGPCGRTGFPPRPSGMGTVLFWNRKLSGQILAAQSGNRYRSNGKESCSVPSAARSSQLSWQIGKELGEIIRRTMRLIRPPKPRPISPSPARNPTALSRTPPMTRKHKINRIFRQGSCSLPFCMGKTAGKSFCSVPKIYAVSISGKTDLW